MATRERQELQLIGPLLEGDTQVIADPLHFLSPDAGGASPQEKPTHHSIVCLIPDYSCVSSV